MKKSILALLCICTCTTSAFSQGPILLKGKIGNYPVIAELDIYDDTAASIRYFYESKRKDIELQGSIGKDGMITAICYNNYEEKFDNKSEKLRFKKTAGGYDGTWSTTKKTLPASFTFLSVTAIQNPYSNYDYVQLLKTESPLDYARIAGLQFIKDSVTKKNDYYLDWYHEKYSGIALFRLRKDGMTDAVKKINEQLEEAQVAGSNGALSCTSSRGETDYNQTVNHIFLNGTILSVDISTGYDCGGAHPDFGSSALNFDLATGAAIKLDDVLWFGKNKNLKEDSDEWYRYRDSVFAPKIVSILKSLYPQQMKFTEDEEGCNYADPEVWDFPNWYFTDKGLYLGAYFARVARSCDEPEWSVIPYRIVKQYINPSLKLKLPD